MPLSVYVKGRAGGFAWGRVHPRAARVRRHRYEHGADRDLPMRVAVTGATGFVGTRLVAALSARGDDVTVLSRNAESARERLGVDAVAWDWRRGPAPAEALAGRDVVVHLAGEPVSQRWNAAVKERILESRERGTSELVAGIAAADPRPPRLVSASACAYYGAHGDEVVD